MITHKHEVKMDSEKQLSSYEQRTKLTRLLIDRIGGIIIVVGGILTFLGYFLPVDTFIDMAHHPVIVEGDSNFLLPFISFIVIGIGVALIIQTKQHWNVFLCLGIAILIGLISHYLFCVRYFILPPPVSGPGYFDFDAGALLPFLGLFLSLVGLIVGLIHRRHL
jgi:hypothetical protein